MKKILLPVTFVLAGLLVFIVYLYLSDPTPDEFKVDRELFTYQSRYLELENGARL